MIDGRWYLRKRRDCLEAGDLVPATRQHRTPCAAVTFSGIIGDYMLNYLVWHLTSEKTRFDAHRRQNSMFSWAKIDRHEHLREDV